MRVFSRAVDGQRGSQQKILDRILKPCATSGGTRTTVGVGKVGAGVV